MKQFLIFLAILCGYMLCGAQTRTVTVGDLKYSLIGATAWVVPNDDYGNSTEGDFPSKYTKETYVIPSYITYDDMEYEVTRIDEYAFSGRTAESSYSYQGATGSPAKEIILPSTIQYIGSAAFANCTNLSTMVIPSNVTGFLDNKYTFYNTPKLKALIYLSSKAPTRWMAGRNTYVPNMEKYSSPYISIAGAKILPIIPAIEQELIYRGDIPPSIFPDSVADYKLTIDYSQLDKNVGTHKISLDAKLSNKYITYDFKVPIQYTIKPTEVVVSTADVSREYGDPNPSLTCIYDGLVGNETADVFETAPTAITTASPTSSVGKYQIDITEAKAQNYTFKYIPGELTVVPAPLSAEVQSVSCDYGSAIPSFTLKYTGLKNGETEPAWDQAPSFQTNATKASPIGEYPVSATAVPTNYDLSAITNGIYTINPAKLIATAHNKSKLYYEENPELTYMYNGFRNGETDAVISTPPSLTTDATLESNSGEYKISISGAAAPNYEVHYQPGVLNIKPRTLSVVTDNYERAYGEENPSFELSYDGFAPQESVDNLIKAPIAETNATKDSNVGTYPITISGGEAENYTFNYSKGQLRVVKAEQEIVWDQDLSDLTVGQQIELAAYSTSGLPISYSLERDGVCELYSVGNKKYLDCIGAGTINIRATQAGNENYHSSPRVSKEASVKASSGERPILTIKQLPIGAISTMVDHGAIYSFTIDPEPDWMVNSISINGIDYTNLLDENGIFTTPTITQNTNIVISYTNSDSGINNFSMPSIKVLGCDGGINIIGAGNGDEINIYTSDGRIAKSLKADNDDIFIPLKDNNTYIIKAGSVTAKIRL
ncbi:MAG: leucine-rich repeat protein [[Clostridium] fimetarium]|nr:leucine-rich repeat protein [Alistipes timonensis]MCM1405927.1 leucine-rich repeat protein [[Clostridium] fimetarium]